MTAYELGFNKTAEAYGIPADTLVKVAYLGEIWNIPREFNPYKDPLSGADVDNADAVYTKGDMANLDKYMLQYSKGKEFQKKFKEGIIPKKRWQSYTNALSRITAPYRKLDKKSWGEQLEPDHLERLNSNYQRFFGFPANPLYGNPQKPATAAPVVQKNTRPVNRTTGNNR